MKDDLVTEGAVGRTGRRGPVERVRLLREFRRSGLTQREFTSRHGMSVATLQNWMRWERANAGKEVSFEEVQIQANPVAVSGGWDAEVAMPSGVVLRLRGNLAVEIVGGFIHRG